VYREYREQADYISIQLQFIICYQTSVFFELQVRTKENLDILSTERNYIAKNRATLITPNRSNKKKIRRQSIAFGHKTTNTIKLTAIIFYQLDIVETDQKFARLKLLISAEFFCYELSFVCYQRLSTFFRSRICFCF